MNRNDFIFLKIIVKLTKVIDEEKLQENAHVVGSYFINEMTKLKNEISIIGDVRGRGLMIAVELVEDRVNINIILLFYIF